MHTLYLNHWSKCFLSHLSARLHLIRQTPLRMFLIFVNQIICSGQNRLHFSKWWLIKTGSVKIKLTDHSKVFRYLICKAWNYFFNILLYCVISLNLVITTTWRNTFQHFSCERGIIENDWSRQEGGPLQDFLDKCHHYVLSQPVEKAHWRTVWLMKFY